MKEKMVLTDPALHSPATDYIFGKLMHDAAQKSSGVKIRGQS